MLQKIQKFLAGRSSTERAGLYIAAFFVLAAFSDRVIVRPIVARTDKVNKDIEEQKDLIRESARVLAQKGSLEKEIANYEHALTESRSEEEETAIFLKEVGALASASSVYVIDMKFRGVIAGEGSVRYAVNVNCEGQMKHIVKFMYLLGRSENLLKIISYNLTPKSKESSIVKANLTIHKLRTQSESAS